MTVGHPASELSARVEGAVGRITLTRSSRLNALTHGMVRTLFDTLSAWENDAGINLVIIEAEPGKAFCAGGDVKTMYRMGLDGDVDGVRRFFADEYRLNALISRYSKPYVALMDGITMGGGIGISAHGSHRIVTERSVLAMPECVIGLIPDVGATELLARAPGHLGEYLALSGARCDAGGALHAGLADYYVPSERMETLVAALVQSADVAAIDSFTTACTPSPFAERAGEIDTLFGAECLDHVLEGVAGDERDWVTEAHRSMQRASPLSLRATFDLVRQARRQPGIKLALMREYRFVSRAIEQADFLEGVRAALVDKDGAPVWRHAHPADVTADELHAFQDIAPGGDVRLG